MTVVPEYVAESLTCKTCFKYLTVGPISIDFEGDRTCGRCVKYLRKNRPIFLFFGHPRDVEMYIPTTLLGYITRKSLFPCVNKFEGCKQLLKFSEVEEHEKSCVFEPKKCPKCDFKGVGSQMLSHFKKVHRKIIFDNIPFCLTSKKDVSEIYLYKKQNFLFFVKICYVKDMHQFLFDTSCTNCVGKLAKIVIFLKISSEEISVISKRLKVCNKGCVLSFRVNYVNLDDIDQIFCRYRIVFDAN